MRPNDVTFENSEQLRKKLLDDTAKIRAIGKYKVGDRVRIEKYKHGFEKGYMPRFTEELYTIARVRTSSRPITYRLVNEDGKELRGWFYNEELCRVL